MALPCAVRPTFDTLCPNWMGTNPVKGNSMIRVAVIGTGAMGQHHIKTLSQLEGVYLVAVADPVAPPPGCLPPHTLHFDSLDTLLTEVAVDAVCITAPTSHHHALATMALSHHLDVLIEKPITSTPDQAHELIALAQQYNRLIQVGHIERFNPAVIQLLTHYQSGAWGEARLIQTHRMSPRPTRITDANVMIDLAVHDLEVIRSIMGMEPQAVHSIAHASDQYTLDTGIITLTYPHCVASVTVSWASPLRARQLSMITSQGLVSLDYRDQTLDWTAHDGITQHIPVTPEPPLMGEWRHFLSCIQTRQSPCVDGYAGLSALQWATTMPNVPTTPS